MTTFNLLRELDRLFATAMVREFQSASEVASKRRAALRNSTKDHGAPRVKGPARQVLDNRITIAPKARSNC